VSKLEPRSAFEYFFLSGPRVGQPSPTAGAFRLANGALLCVCAGLMVTAAGCNSLGNAKIVKQLQTDNERLLSEFRAEKARRERAEQRVASVELKLAESEKLLARQYESGQRVPHLSSRQPEVPLPTNIGSGSSTSVGGHGSSGEGDAFRWQRRMN
jgi:hypothetical protein